MQSRQEMWLTMTRKPQFYETGDRSWKPHVPLLSPSKFVARALLQPQPQSNLICSFNMSLDQVGTVGAE